MTKRLAQLTTLTGVGLGEIAALNEAQIAALVEVAEDEQRRRVWSNDTELLASILDRLGVIAARLEAGLRVGFPKDGKMPAPKAPEPTTRPEWLERAAPASRTDEAVMTPREFFAAMRARKA